MSDDERCDRYMAARLAVSQHPPKPNGPIESRDAEIGNLRRKVREQANELIEAAEIVLSQRELLHRLTKDRDGHDDLIKAIRLDKAELQRARDTACALVLAMRELVGDPV